MSNEPIFSRIGYTTKSARVEDFRKTFHPIPFINIMTFSLGAGGVGGHLFYNYLVKKPWYATMHKTFAIGCAGAWAGYYVTRLAYQHKMGKFKYALDYIERHKDDFPEKELKRFGDPSWLQQWRPIR